MAYANIIGSVVQVNGYDPEARSTRRMPTTKALHRRPETETPDEFKEDFHEDYTAVGTGVVIDEDGTILTNLHVAAAASKLRVVFWDGSESDARIIGAQPENDLAVIMPDILPDDLKPATLASTAGLIPGRRRGGGGLSVRHRPVGLGRGGFGAQALIRGGRQDRF